VAVEAVGLNFRDVMWASGLLPEEALADGFFGPRLGLEGAGHILATGPGVSRVAAGDRVMFFASQSFATRLTTPETAVMRLPDGLPGRQAAGLPVAFGTVWYALAHLARMRPGETLLVHGAAGGVGLAALEISRRLGLTVLATAGSEERRGFLKMMGAAEVFDSRCLAFSDQVLAATGGRGVDAVLNSIAGEAVARSLGCLASFGRFLELGKRDFYQDSSLGLYPFRRNLSYFGIDVDQLMSFDPALAAALAGELEQMFRRAEVGALPCTVMPFEQTRVAFNHLRESRPIGKMVVDLTGLEAAEVPVRPGPRAKPKKTAPGPWGLKKDASYLVTGASGGFGLATARHLFEQGAGHLFLLGRRAAEGELADLLAAGAGKAELVRVDLADGPALTESLTWALAGKPPLRGVIHAAAVYDDAQALKLSPERLRPVMAGKARGAWNLHQFTKDRELDFFILYSSLAALIGNPGQANYVAANMVLENLAVYRRSLGLPALAVRWGAIRDAGLLTRRPELLSTLEKLMGERAMTVKEALNLLPVFLENGEAVATLARSKWRGTRMLPVLSQPLFAGLNPASASEANEVGLADLINGQTPEKAVKEIVKFVTGRLADILRLPVRRISPEAPFSSFGMDSLMMAELLSGLEEAAGGALNLGSLSQDESLHSLAEKLYLDLARPDLAGSGMAAEEREFLESMARRHGIELPAA
jgi:NADPH:quinone reductase-like Zn-dependent oxidoreductase/acyl carrier protein